MLFAYDHLLFLFLHTCYTVNWCTATQHVSCRFVHGVILLVRAGNSRAIASTAINIHAAYKSVRGHI